MEFHNSDVVWKRRSPRVFGGLLVLCFGMACSDPSSGGVGVDTVPAGGDVSPPQDMTSEIDVPVIPDADGAPLSDTGDALADVLPDVEVSPEDVGSADDVKGDVLGETDASVPDGEGEDTSVSIPDSLPVDGTDPSDGGSVEADVDPLADISPPPVDVGGGTNGLLDPCPAVIQVAAPIADLFTAVGQPVELEAKLVPVGLPITDWTGHHVEWGIGSGTVVATTLIDAVGNLGQSSGMATFMDVDTTVIQARLVTPEGMCEWSSPVSFHVCGEWVDEGFEPAGPPGWVLYGNAVYPGNGTVELTGNVTGSGGALYNDAVTVSEGNASMEMTFSTGGGSNTGADGFALTIVNLDTVQELISMLGSASNGGGLGYGVSGAYGSWVGDALHVEVDTWYNFIPNNPHTDPVDANHVSINLNGDPGNHIWFQAIPSIEDQSLHTIRVDVIGSIFKVFYDGQLLVTQEVQGLDFRGGYIFFSASTGWATNFHTIDHLQVIHGCK